MSADLLKVANAIGGTNGATVLPADTGSGDQWSGQFNGSGTGFTYSNTQTVHSESLSYKVDPGSGTEHRAYRIWSPLSSAALTEIWIRGYVRFTALPGVRFSLHRCLAGSSVGIDFGFDTSGHLSVHDNGGNTIGSGTVATSLTAFVRYTFHAVLGSTPTFEAWTYQGVNLEDPATFADHIPSTASTTAAIGSSYDTVYSGNCANNNETTPFYFSDLAIASDGDPGPYSLGESSGSGGGGGTPTSTTTTSWADYQTIGGVLVGAPYALPTS